MISQEIVFEKFGFNKHHYDYSCGSCDCYKAPNGQYIRVGHYSNFYALEYADSEYDAEKNLFDDIDLYKDDMPEEEIIKLIQQDIQKYLVEEA